MPGRTDRELLELAAKAAGIKAKWFKVKKWKDYDGARWLIGRDDVFGTHHSKPWNPLTDDGDALRLAVKLKMTLGVGIARADEGARSGFDEPCDYAATRLAIVRAAAEIGANMQS
jgi:hypothetical protein